MAILVQGPHAPVESLGRGVHLLRGVLRSGGRDVVQLRARGETRLGRNLEVVLPCGGRWRPMERRREGERHVVVRGEKGWSNALLLEVGVGALCRDIRGRISVEIRRGQDNPVVRRRFVQIGERLAAGPNRVGREPREGVVDDVRE